MLRVDNLLVVERVVEFGVRYVQEGAVPQEFFSKCQNQHEAVRRAKSLEGQVVQRTIFTTEWQMTGAEG